MRKPLSKGMKILRNLMVILLALILTYIAIGCPILFPRLRMQLAEQNAGVGPSTLIHELSHLEYPEFQKVLVGETEYGYVFYSQWDSTTDSLSYCEKTGSMTLLAAPINGNWQYDYIAKSLPIYLFHEHPNAVRAELDLQIAGDSAIPSYKGEQFTRNYSLEATRDDDRYFLFFLPVSLGDDGTLGTDGLAATVFSRICHHSRDKFGQAVYATVRLYDSNGVLIEENNLTVTYQLPSLS